MEYKFTVANFDTEVLGSNIPVLVDLYADWCGPCKMMGPVVAEMAEKFEGKIKVGKLNVDNDGAIAQKYGVASIPTFLFFQDGKVVEKAIGAMSSDDLEALINQVLL